MGQAMAHAITTTMTNTVIVLQIQVLTLIWLRNLIDSSFGQFRSLSMVLYTEFHQILSDIETF